MQVGVRARELAGHHHRDLEDVDHELPHAAHFRRRPIIKVPRRDVADFRDEPEAHVTPGFDRLLQQ